MSSNNQELEKALDNLVTQNIDDRLADASIKLLHEVAEDTEAYVPYRTGYLSNSATINESTLTLSYTAKYADYVNKMTGLKFNQSVHKLAQADWLTASKSANIGKWMSNFKKNISK